MFTFSVAYPERTIVSPCNSCTENMSGFIDKILQAHAKGLDYFK